MTTTESDYFALSPAGFIVPMLTGLLSAFSSAIILNIIRASPDKLSTTYHRIMASMSVFDFIASICIALVTLPMPTGNLWEFSGPMIGNHLTCQLQGYFITLGMGGGGALYMCLSWYFVLSISFKFSANTMKRRVEPIMYAYALFIAFFTPSYFLSKDLIHSDLRAAYCTIAIDPPTTSTCTDLSCDDDHLFYKLEDGVAIWVGINLALIISAMLIILRTIHKNNRIIKVALKSENLNTSVENEVSLPEDRIHTDLNLVAQLRQSRSSMVQALMYIIAYFVTWFFLLLRYIDAQYYMDVGAAILFPLQGFWNMIIFVYDKAHSVYQTDACDNLHDAVKVVFFSPSKIPCLLIELQVVVDNNNELPIITEGVGHSIPSTVGGVQSFNSSDGNEGNSSAGQDLFQTSACHSASKSEGEIQRAPQVTSTLANRYPFFHSKRNSM